MVKLNSDTLHRLFARKKRRKGKKAVESYSKDPRNSH